MDVDLGKSLLQVAEQFFVPLQWQRRMEPTLHQDLVAAKGDGFFNLCVELVSLEHIAFCVLGGAIERAEVADRRADVGVVDVAVDVVRPPRLRVQPPRDRVGGMADRGEVGRRQEGYGVVTAEPLTSQNIVEDRACIAGHSGHSSFTKRNVCGGLVAAAIPAEAAGASRPKECVRS